MSIDVPWMGQPAVRSDHDFEAAFTQHYATVYRLLYRYVGDEADDLAQEVFLQLYRHPPLGPVSAIKAWLLRTATNRGLNALRSGRRREKYRDLLGHLSRGTGWRSAEKDPEQASAMADARDQVREVLSQLKPAQARILMLRHGGLAYREIAQALAIAPGSVGTLLARAERAFEKRWRQCFGTANEGEVGRRQL